MNIEVAQIIAALHKL